MQAYSRHALPALPFVIWYVVGVLAGEYFVLANLAFLFYCISIFSIILIVVLSTSSASVNRFPIATSILISIVLSCAGIGRILETKQQNAIVLPPNEATWLVKNVEQSGRTGKFTKYRFIAQIYKPSLNSVINSRQYRIIGYLARDLPLLQNGQYLVTNKRLQLPEEPKNPFQFNYKSYLERKHIAGQLFLRKGEEYKLILSLPPEQDSYLKKFKSYLIRQIDRFVEPDQQWLVKAMFLGDRLDMTAEHRDAYAAAGVMHILAVSGLHVGILYIIFSTLLLWLNPSKKLPAANVIILISILWIYGFITGLSPSTVRACIMFSLIAIGQGYKRQTNIMQSLLLSALVILWINPANLYEVGFQLSYAAVISIVYLQPRIAKIFKPESTILKYFWSLVSVTVAAQVGTLPLTLFYFQQFPTYFIISNLAAVPLAFGVVVLSVSLVGTSWFTPMGSLLGWLLSLIIKVLNLFIALINNLPNSKIIVWFSATESIISYLILIFLISFWLGKRPYKVWAILCGVLILGGSILYTQYIYLHQNLLSVYNVSGQSILSFVAGRNRMLLTNSVPRAALAYNYNIAAHQLRLGFNTRPDFDSFGKKPISIFESAKLQLIVVNGKALSRYSLDQSNKLEIEKTKLQSMIVLVNEPEIDIVNLVKMLGSSQVILDASSKPEYQNMIINVAKENGIVVYSTSISGAFSSQQVND